MSTPLVSVILVCRNPGERVRRALASIWSQKNARFEVIVIDGASTDGTPEWLQSERNRLGSLISEPDQGIYDAMNKGVAAARGEWVIFLGADDQLAGSLVLAEAAKCLAQVEADVVVGEATYDDGRIYRFDSPTGAIRRNFAHHQAAIYRRSLFDAHGNFPTNLLIMADYEFNLRLLQTGVTFRSIALRVAICGSRGLSDAGGWAGYREEIQVRHRYFPAWRCWLWDLGSVIRFLRKKFLLPFSHG